MKTRIEIACTLLLVLTLAVPACADKGGFAVRGIKGLWWQGIEKYQKAVPWLAEHNMNFLMLCYTSFPASSMDWRSDYTLEEMEQLRELSKQAKAKGINLCLSFNPGIWSKPPLVYSSDQDYHYAWKKVKSIHTLGINWFALCLDDIGRELTPADKDRFGTLQAAQTHFVNRLWQDMKTLTPRPKLIFCPSAYTTEDAQQHQDYIKTVGEGVDRDVMMFWTGPQCCSSSITADDAKRFAKWIRRKPFIWDNYPVNDMYSWRPLIGPLKNRSSDLAGAVSGYMSNPMKQWNISRIPLSTTASYLTDPANYDPNSEMEKVIRNFPVDQQRAVRLLVELYGSTFWGEAGFPPQPRPANTSAASKMLPKYRLLKKELSTNPSLSDIWEDVKTTLESDIRILEKHSRDRNVERPLEADGWDFKGGAGEIFGYYMKDRGVNYVYAKSTGKDEMHVDLHLRSVPKGGASLRVLAIDDDSPDTAGIEITINGHSIFSGKAPFGRDVFTEKSFPVKADMLRSGANTLSIRNTEENGVLGMPPWFMVAEVELIPHN